MGGDGAASAACAWEACCTRTFTLQDAMERRGGGLFFSLLVEEKSRGLAVSALGQAIASFLEELAQFQNLKTNLRGYFHHVTSPPHADADSMLGQSSLGAGQTRDAILAALARGHRCLKFAPGPDDPTVQRMCEDRSCEAERLVAYVAGPLGASLEDLAQETVLDRFGAPSRCEISLLEQMPRTRTGKIARRLLAAGLASRGATAAPRTETERRVAAIWRDVLGLSDAGVDDNVFELGGNSLLLVQLHSRLEAEFGPRLSLVEMFQYPTIRALAGCLARQESPTPQASPVRLGQQRAEVRRKARSPSASTAGVAVIGLACRFPGLGTQSSSGGIFVTVWNPSPGSRWKKSSKQALIPSWLGTPST